jgi:hypothetical protein
MSALLIARFFLNDHIILQKSKADAALFYAFVT